MLNVKRIYLNASVLLFGFAIFANIPLFQSSKLNLLDLVFLFLPIYAVMQFFATNVKLNIEKILFITLASVCATISYFGKDISTFFFMIRVIIFSISSVFILMVIQDKALFNLLFMGLLMGHFYNCLFLIDQYFEYGIFDQDFIRKTAIWWSGDGKVRYSGYLNHPNEFAQIMTLGAPLY